MRIPACLVVLLISISALPAAVFQYRVGVPAKKGERDIFLWIPPEAERVRGVVISGQTLAERHIMTDPRVREVCARQSLALIFSKGGIGQGIAQLGHFAEVSGYKELVNAPLFFHGHSAGGPPAKAQAVEHYQRCFGLMQFRGGGPGGATPVPPGVPCLMMVGQFDEFGGWMRDPDGKEDAWENAIAHMTAYRAADPANLGSVMVEVGAGHFAWSDRCAEYFCAFLEGAAQARIPEWSVDAAAPVTCAKVDPEAGWLTSLNLRDADATAIAANTVDVDAGMAWHPSEAVAQAAIAAHGARFAGKDQFIRWEDPYWVDAGTRYFFTKITWVEGGDVFQVHPVYATTYPAMPKNGQGPKWGRAGQPATHSEAPIKVKVVGGPMVPVGEHRLRMEFDGTVPVGERFRGTFMAYSEGDAEHRYTEHVGMLPRGYKGQRKGANQTITFPPIGQFAAAGEPVALAATSDQELAVRYYVAWGPATVVDGKLIVTDLPKRATLPIEVKVVAWQFGSGVDPLVKSAAPVEQVIQLQP